MGGAEPRRLNASPAGLRGVAPSASVVARAYRGIAPPDWVVASVFGRQHKGGVTCGIALAAPCSMGLGLAAHTASASSLTGLDPDLKSYPLHAAEFGRLDIRAGWVDGAPERMVCEIRNPLAAPVHCASVQLELRDRGRAVRGLEPAVWVPANQLRRTGTRPLRKEEAKQFSLVCTCLRRSDKGPCEPPLKP